MGVKKGGIREEVHTPSRPALESTHILPGQDFLPLPSTWNLAVEITKLPNRADDLVSLKLLSHGYQR